MVSSGVWSEAIALQRAHHLPEVGGTRTMKQELDRIGYLGEMDASYQAMPLAVRRSTVNSPRIRLLKLK